MISYVNDKEKARLNNFLHSILQTIKKFFYRLLKIETEKDKDDVVSEIKEYHKRDLYDIANNTSKEQEINDYLYTKDYEYDEEDIEF